MEGEVGKRLRFDLGLLDPDDPFEIDDGNRPHLFKHLPEDSSGRPVAVGPGEILDAYLYGDPAYFEADNTGEADWLMIGEVPGITILVPLAPPRSGSWDKCRPIGIYTPSAEDRRRYQRGEING